MCSDLVAASQACAMFSATGILFMSWVGIMLMKQPFFIGGIDDVEVAKGSAFGAAGTFFFTFCASILYIIKEFQHPSQRQQQQHSSNGARTMTRNPNVLASVLGTEPDYGPIPLQEDFRHHHDDDHDDDDMPPLQQHQHRREFDTPREFESGAVFT